MIKFPVINYNFPYYTQISFKGKTDKEPIYEIGQNKELTKYNSRAELLAHYPNICYTSLCSHLSGKTKTCGKRVFRKESELYKEENGEKVLKEDELNKAYEMLTQGDGRKRKAEQSSRIIEILPNGKAKKYENEDEVLKTYPDIRRSYFISRLKMGKNFCAGHIFYEEADLTYIDEDGKEKIKPEKKEELKSLFQELTGGIRGTIYEIKSDGSLIKYSNYREILDKYADVRYANLSVALCKKSATCRGHIFVKPQQITKRNAEGKLVVDREKIREYVQTLKKSERKQKSKDSYFTEPFYVISRQDKKARLFESIKEASDATMLSRKTTIGLLNNEISNRKYVICPKEDIEGENGIDEDKLKKVLKRGPCGFYALNFKTGEWARFDNRTELCQQLNLKSAYVNRVLAKTYRYTNNYIIVRESEITDEDGNVDANKIKKIIQDFKDENTPQTEPVIVVKGNGSYTKYKNQKEVVHKTGLNPSEISTLVNGKTKQIRGMSAAYEKNLAIYDDEGNVIGLDEEKIKELASRCS